ncbi:MAG TPA: hypothetical protein PK020_15130 [Ilumatobacteraceae bacterium]|nr:hypothetical protein [Ilumatobacteraceae bacterium]HRB02412.1 hypothetical protein [Ilumatobacteraceae bacterium]
MRRGEPWGEQVQSPDFLRVAPTDRDAREWVVAQRETGRALQAVGLGGGDMARTLGGGTPGRFPGVVMTAPIDVLRVEADGRTTWAVAHVVARRSWWRGDVWLAMNAQFLGDYDIAPRSHPNDGKVDVIHVHPDMPVRARRQARRRARTGTHLPHPQLHSTQSATASATFRQPLVLWVDGVRWGTAASITVTCEPDALTIYA